MFGLLHLTASAWGKQTNSRKSQSSRSFVVSFVQSFLHISSFAFRSPRKGFIVITYTCLFKSLCLLTLILSRTYLLLESRCEGCFRKRVVSPHDKSVFSVGTGWGWGICRIWNKMGHMMHSGWGI